MKRHLITIGLFLGFITLILAPPTQAQLLNSKRMQLGIKNSTIAKTLNICTHTIWCNLNGKVKRTNVLNQIEKYLNEFEEKQNEKI